MDKGYTGRYWGVSSASSTELIHRYGNQRFLNYRRDTHSYAAPSLTSWRRLTAVEASRKPTKHFLPVVSAAAGLSQNYLETVRDRGEEELLQLPLIEVMRRDQTGDDGSS